jgi:coenzyme F420-reducing hydrogenase delta subunit
MNDTWTPRIVVFQCQYSLYCEADQTWMDTQLPPHIKLIQVPCTGRISPLFVLNAVQGGADGIMISGCQPEKCHFKEGNLGARRQLEEFRRFLTYLGMGAERMRFAWIDLSERGRIQQELADLEKTIRAIGPNKRLVTRATTIGEQP